MIMVVYSWSSVFYFRFDGPFGRRHPVRRHIRRRRGRRWFCFCLDCPFFQRHLGRCWCCKPHRHLRPRPISVAMLKSFQTSSAFSSAYTSTSSASFCHFQYLSLYMSLLLPCRSYCHTTDRLAMRWQAHPSSLYPIEVSDNQHSKQSISQGIPTIKRPNTGPYKTVEEQIWITLGRDCSMLLMSIQLQLKTTIRTWWVESVAEIDRSNTYLNSTAASTIDHLWSIDAHKTPER